MARIWLENDGTFVKWAGTKPGTELTSVYGGLPLGRYGWITDLETAEGTLTLPAPVKLERQLARVRPGAEVTIRYLGMGRTKTGREFHDFKVAAEEADVMPELKRAATPAKAKEVPF